MTDWLEIGLDLLVVLLTFGLAYYSYRLSRFFRGGKFETTFKVLMAATLFFGIAEVFHTLGELLEMSIPETGHTALEAVFVLLLFLAFNLFYRAWTKLTKE